MGTTFCKACGREYADRSADVWNESLFYRSFQQSIENNSDDCHGMRSRRESVVPDVPLVADHWSDFLSHLCLHDCGGVPLHKA